LSHNGHLGQTLAIGFSKSQWIEWQQYICLSINIESTSLEVALNKTTESYSNLKHIQVRQFLRHLDFAIFEYGNLANFSYPEFQGVRCTRDQTMPGPFLAPPTFKGKALGTRLPSSV